MTLNRCLRSRMAVVMALVSVDGVSSFDDGMSRLMAEAVTFCCSVNEVSMYRTIEDTIDVDRSHQLSNDAAENLPWMTMHLSHHYPSHVNNIEAEPSGPITTSRRLLLQNVLLGYR